MSEFENRLYRLRENNETERFPTLLWESDIVTHDYMCSWSNQSSTAAKLGLTGEYGSQIRDVLNAKLLFETEAYYHQASRELRKDLIFLLDDGWDVPYGNGDKGRDEYLRGYGAVDPDQERFPGFGKTPVERLRTIREKCEQLGYRGVGVWIAPQQSGEQEYDPAAAEAYWEERARWCQEAGIMYWKVDWGYHCHENDYRELMTRAARKTAPELIIEHTVVQQPLSLLMSILWHGGPDYPAMRRKMAKQVMEFNDVFRTYDIASPLQNGATLGRAHEALASGAERKYGALGLINAESESYIASVLGFCIGIMQYTKESEACLKWHRVAPPFGIYDADYTYSKEMLADSFFYDEDVDGWIQCGGRYFEEAAPAIMARNCELPLVVACGEYKPFVAASKNPYTGVYSLGAFRRTVDPNENFIAPADVTLKIDTSDALVGIFGVFHSVCIECPAGYPEDVRVYAQNLLDDKSLDITEFVQISGNRITLDGCDLRILGRVPKGDPALAVRIRR